MVEREAPTLEKDPEQKNSADKSKVSDYSLYKKILCLTKGFLETAKPHDGLERLFCFFICPLEAEEGQDKGVTNFQLQVCKKRCQEEGRDGWVGTGHLFIRLLVGVAQKKPRQGSFKAGKGVS